MKGKTFKVVAFTPATAKVFRRKSTPRPVAALGTPGGRPMVLCKKQSGNNKNKA